MPPNGQRTISFDSPPTWRAANACPNSCIKTITNSARYSATFHTMDEYSPAPRPMKYHAAINHVQWRFTSMPEKRKSQNAPDCVGSMWRKVGRKLLPRDNKINEG